MPIILISSDCLESAEQIALGTAQTLGYQCLGPEILNNIAAQHEVSGPRH